MINTPTGNGLYVIRIITTGNLLKRRGSDMPLYFDSEYNAESYIEIYGLRRSIMEIVPAPVTPLYLID